MAAVVGVASAGAKAAEGYTFHMVTPSNAITISPVSPQLMILNRLGDFDALPAALMALPLFTQEFLIIVIKD
jgi:hypothetical protein